MIAVITFAERLIEFRRAVGINQRNTFATRSKVSGTTIWQLETHIGLPFHERADDTRENIARVVQKSVVELDEISKASPRPDPLPKKITSSMADESESPTPEQLLIIDIIADASEKGIDRVNEVLRELRAGIGKGKKKRNLRQAAKQTGRTISK